MKTVYYRDDFIIFIVPRLIVKRSNSTNLFITGRRISLFRAFYFVSSSVVFVMCGALFLFHFIFLLCGWIVWFFFHLARLFFSSLLFSRLSLLWAFVCCIVSTLMFVRLPFLFACVQNGIKDWTNWAIIMAKVFLSLYFIIFYASSVSFFSFNSQCMLHKITLCLPKGVWWHWFSFYHCYFWPK